jgi:hypothetical protein
MEVAYFHVVYTHRGKTAQLYIISLLALYKPQSFQNSVVYLRIWLSLPKLSTDNLCAVIWILMFNTEKLLFSPPANPNENFLKSFSCN